MSLAQIKRIYALLAIIGVARSSPIKSDTFRKDHPHLPTYDHIPLTQYNIDKPSVCTHLITSRKEETHLICKVEKISQYTENVTSASLLNNIKDKTKKFILIKDMSAKKTKNLRRILIFDDIKGEEEITTLNPDSSTEEKETSIIDEKNYLVLKSLYACNKSNKTVTLVARIFEYASSGKIYQIIVNMENIDNEEFKKHASFLSERLKNCFTESMGGEEENLEYHFRYLETIFNFHLKDIKNITTTSVKEIMNLIQDRAQKIIRTCSPYCIMAIPIHQINNLVSNIINQVIRIKTLPIYFNESTNEMDSSLNRKDLIAEIKKLLKKIEALKNLQKSLKKIVILKWEEVCIVKKEEDRNKEGITIITKNKEQKEKAIKTYLTDHPNFSAELDNLTDQKKK